MGGHLREAVVSATCEIWLSSFRDGIGRKKSGESGLDLLDLPPGDE
jgi:predicted DNA-binding protein with PD1-like motif